jgi:hypothetical protein
VKKLKKIRNACAPAALCHCSGINEDTVLRICVSCGFDIRGGMGDDEWQEAADDLGLKLKKVPTELFKLRDFVQKYPNGLFLVTTQDHILCVDGGVVYDPREKLKGRHPGLNRAVYGGWRVSKK